MTSKQEDILNKVCTRLKVEAEQYIFIHSCVDSLLADQKRLILEKTNPFPEKTTDAYWFTRAGITAGKIYQEAIDDYMNSIKEE